MMIELKTASEVVEALDGPSMAGRITGRNATAVCNWRTRNKLPSDTYLVISDFLRAKGKTAPASLWGMRETVAAE